MLWIALIALAQLSAPVPINLQKWATPDDVPVRMLPFDRNLVVGFHVIVDPTGKTRDCHVFVSSGIKDLDSYTCKLVMRRARFEPASDVNGASTYGAYESYLSWWVGEDNAGPPPPPFAGDLDLVVNALPAGTKSPATVRVVFAVDAQGRVSSCAAEKQKPEPSPKLVQIACGQIAQQVKPQAVVDAKGIPVASVQNAEVRFSTE